MKWNVLRFFLEEKEALEDDNLEPLEENARTSFRNQLTCLWHGPEGGSLPVLLTSKHKPAVESSEDNLDHKDLLQV
jgi:hypothetical protein